LLVWITAVAQVPLLLLAIATPALAATAAPGYAVTDFATGFVNSGTNGIGPLGLAFDGPGIGANLYVMDYINGILYRFPSTGGVASAGTQVGGPLAGRPDGISFSVDFAHLYVARQAAGDVLEISPTTGAVIRTVASGIPCATGLATDPLTGDLFVSEVGCGSQIIRVNTVSGAKSVYANAPDIDGLSFDPRDGTLYGASAGSNIAVIDRSGHVTFINPGPSASSLDGIAVAATRVPGQPPFIFVNQNNGVISKVDLTLSPPATSTVTSGGSRGDFVTVGPDGCLYATQTDRVIRVTNADGSCSLAPPDPAITAAGTPVTAVEGAAFNGTVATVSDPDPLATANEYAATIQWGDGSSSPGTIVGSGPAGHFSVSGTHTYGEEGSYTIEVDVADVDTPTNAATATSPAAVSDAALSASGTSLTTTNPVSGVVAHFTDADPAGTVGDYSATVDWGDGSSSGGTISASGSGFDVSGTHTYAALGPYTVHTHICDVGGSCADATTPLLVFAFPSGAGDFVVGDLSSTGSVTYWGAQWAKVNHLSGGDAPSSFKGFAASSTPAVPACGGTWTTGPGNSADPPDSLPTYVGVIVANSISKSGPTISGNEVRIIVVRTDPGYAPDPGHAGTGTVVGVVC
jgi:hypothetical protein